MPSSKRCRHPTDEMGQLFKINRSLFKKSDASFLFIAVMSHYKTLKLSPNASAQEIRQAYRRLVKKFHPDSQSNQASHEQIVRINAAYEVLGDPSRRYRYDQSPREHSREVRNYQASRQGRNCQQTARVADDNLDVWLAKVYAPIATQLPLLSRDLEIAINELSADIFDDQLMTKFQICLEKIGEGLQASRRQFTDYPSPRSLAKVAAFLYYSMNHVEDALEELNFFTLNYDETSLHNGQELFRLMNDLLQEAEQTVQRFV